MKLVVIFGPQAVGKMTVGHELEKITDLKLFHNHMSIELVLNFFNYGTPSFRRLSNLFREEVFKEVVNSDLGGLIFTYLWNFDDPKYEEYLENLVKIFRVKNAEIIYIELEAGSEERLKRNKTEHRLNHKPTKRNIEKSEENLLESIQNHRVNSKEGEVKEKNYMKINNTNLEPEKVAQIIKEKFNL